MLIPQILATMPKTTTIKNIIAPTTTANSLTNGINADNPNVIIVTQIKQIHHMVQGVEFYVSSKIQLLVHLQEHP